jgi:hypothetical protein
MAAESRRHPLLGSSRRLARGPVARLTAVAAIAAGTTPSSSTRYSRSGWRTGDRSAIFDPVQALGGVGFLAIMAASAYGEWRLGSWLVSALSG